MAKRDRDSSTDDKGRARVKCLRCEADGVEAYYHRLEKHLQDTHGMSVDEYHVHHPGAPVKSEAAERADRRAKRRSGSVGRPSPEPEPETDDDGIPAYTFGCARILGRVDLDDEDKVHVPVHDEHWNIGESEQSALEALALGIETNQNVLIVGPPGVGKSTLARELAAIANAPLRYLPINGEIRTDDLMGGDQLLVDRETGQIVTKHVDGPLPEAGERGHWVLFDEFDSLPNHVGFILHGVLEEVRKLTRANGTRVVFDGNFRVIATANTLGLGDDTGHFAGTGPMNRALLDRFGIVIRVGYPEQDDEIEMLVNKCSIRRTVAENMVAVARQVREAAANETSNADLSPRRLLMWAMTTKKMGGNAVKAARYTIINRLAKEDADFVSGLVQRKFGGTP